MHGAERTKEPFLHLQKRFMWGGFLLKYFAALKVYLYKTEENASSPFARAGLPLTEAWSSGLHITTGWRGALEGLGPAACWSRASCVFLVPVYYSSHGDYFLFLFFYSGILLCWCLLPYPCNPLALVLQGDLHWLCGYKMCLISMPPTRY